MNEPVNTLTTAHTILVVENLHKSKMFYQLLFDVEPVVDETNIVELKLNENFILGLITKELPAKLFDAELMVKFKLDKASSAELYFECDNAEKIHAKALQLGCLELSPFQQRVWGHSVGYSVNHDGHVLAFAKGIRKDI